MIRHRFREEKSSLGILLRPVAEVILEKDGFAVSMPMYVDSGADVSMIPFRFGRALGFKQEETDVIRELKGVGGASVPYILKNATLVLREEVRHKDCMGIGGRGSHVDGKNGYIQQISSHI